MFSQGVDHGLVTSPTTFPLSKFSYATVSGEMVKPIPWRHVSDKGHLLAVFSSITPTRGSAHTDGGKILFKVLSGSDIMEDLDLRALGQQATVAAEEMRTLPTPPHFPKVTIIIQEPCIAVRFPLSYGQIRRFQMKFQHGADFYKALAFFSHSGCPFTQAGQIPSRPPFNRPFTAPSNVDHPNNLVQQSVQHLPPGVRADQRPSVASEYTHDPISRQDHNYIPPSSLTGQQGQGQASTVRQPRNVIRGIGLDSEIGAGQKTFSVQEDHKGIGFPMSSRPVTAPVIGNVDPLARMLPPRRELPFKRPSAPFEQDTGPATGQRSNAASKTVLIGDDYGAGDHDNAKGGIAQAASELMLEKPAVKRGNRKSSVATRAASRVTTCKRPSGISPNPRKSRKIDVLPGTDTNDIHKAIRSRCLKESTVTNVPNRSIQNLKQDACLTIDTQNQFPATEDRSQRLLERNRRKQKGSEECQTDNGDSNGHLKKRAVGDKDAEKLPGEVVKGSRKVVQRETAEPTAAGPTVNAPRAIPTGQAPVAKSSLPGGIMISDSSAGKENSRPVDGEASTWDSVNDLHSERRGLGLHSIARLLNDPNFAQSPDLARWADLPAEERKEVLEKWMCEQLDDPGFAELVKTIGGMWQTMLFG